MRKSILIILSLASLANASTHLRPMLGPDADEALPEKATIQADTHPKQQGTTNNGIANRLLQSLTTRVFNALVNTFVPDLGERVADQIGSTMDPVTLNYVTIDDQGQIQLKLNYTFCNETMANASIAYNLGEMTGLKTVDITKLELVDGTDNIDVPFGSLIPGASSTATWSGDWVLEANFIRFNATTSATLSNNFCGFTFEEILNGYSLMGQPTVALRMYLAGETSNIYNFGASSQVNEARLKEMSFGYRSLTPTLGKFGDLVSSLDADAPLVEIGQTGLAGDLKTLIQTNIQNGVNTQLPYRL